MNPKPTYVSIARVWPADTGNAAAALLRAASKRLSAINPAEADRIKQLPAAREDR